MTTHSRFQASLARRAPLVVGVIADNEGLMEPNENECDLIELRLDSLGHGDDVLAFAEQTAFPLLVTARGAAEGGQSDWSLDERAQAHQTLLPHSSLIDIELRDFEPLSKTRAAAAAAGVTVIGSFHNFESTPKIETLIEQAHPEADILKFALMANSSEDLVQHLEIFQTFPDRQLSVMGMGPLGAAARLVMAKSGSLLNYGYLGQTPTAPNQWPARLLKEALSL